MKAMSAIQLYVSDINREREMNCGAVYSTMQSIAGIDIASVSAGMDFRMCMCILRIADKCGYSASNAFCNRATGEAIPYCSARLATRSGSAACRGSLSVSVSIRTGASRATRTTGRAASM